MYICLNALSLSVIGQSRTGLEVERLDAPAFERDFLGPVDKDWDPKDIWGTRRVADVGERRGDEGASKVGALEKEVFLFFVTFDWVEVGVTAVCGDGEGVVVGE